MTYKHTPLMVRIFFVIACAAISSAQASELIDLGEIPVDQYERKSRPTPDFLFGYVGGVVVHSERIVGSNKGVSIPLPVVGVNYKDMAYWNVTKGGAWLWKSRDRSIKFGPLLKLRPAVNTDKDDQLAGLTKRKGSLEAGLGLSGFGCLKTSLEVYQDISGRSDGASAQLRTSKFIKLNDHLSAIPSLAFEWLSDDVVDYYYGVNADESAAGGITTYQGRHATNSRAGLTIADHITKNWALLGGVVYQRYGNGVTGSPMVTKSSNVVFYLGAIYLFLKI